MVLSRIPPQKNSCYSFQRGQKMTQLKQTVKRFSTNNKGFTLLELMIVSLMISILSSIAVYNFTFLKKRAYDSAALSDARNLVESVVVATLNDEDVDFTKTNTGGAVGNVSTSGTPRPPVFVLSPGVQAVITGDSIQAPNGETTVFSATVYHTNGTPDAASPSGKKEYFCFLNESTGTTLLP